MSPRTLFDFELKILKDSVCMMGLHVEKTYDELFRAIEEKDEEVVRRIKKSDREITDMERSIETKCLSLLTKQQPVARDLRIVTASLKVVTDIQRVGDHVVDIAELVLRMGFIALEQYSEHLEIMAKAAKEMFHDAVTAYTERNEEDAKTVIGADDVVDELFNKVKTDLIRSLKSENQNADHCIDILMIAKYLEKIGDHAVNIGQWELFQETGVMDEVRLL